MTTRIGINGFGRIGRQVLRATLERHSAELEIVAVNDLAPPKANAHLFKYDSNYGRYPGEVSAADDAIEIDGKRITSLSERNPSALPWGDPGVDIVIESTGLFTQRELNLLLAFANTAAVALSNARMYAQAEAILAEITQVKELMDNIFSSVGSGIIAIDSQDRVHTFNRAAGEILDMPPESAVGVGVETVMTQAALELSDQLALVKERDADHTLELRADLPRRGQVALAVSLSPLKDSNDEIQGLTLVMDDVTHLQAHEATIKTMKRILPETMVDQISEIANIELGGLRREITCMFADVRPWLTLPAVAPSEKLRILNQYQAVATACIHECSGLIDKYMGNEVMALFNTQLNPAPNHAQQALDCALLMRDRFVALYQSLGIDPRPHYYIVGMFTGEATLGNIGSYARREFTALGHSVNTAKRVQENAARGSITITQQTLEHIQSRHPGRLPYTFRRRAPIYGKGLSAGLRAYEVYRKP